MVLTIFCFEFVSTIDARSHEMVFQLLCQNLFIESEILAKKQGLLCSVVDILSLSWTVK